MTLPPPMCLPGLAGGSGAKWLVPVWAHCPGPVTAAIPSEVCHARLGRGGKRGCTTILQPVLPDAEAQHAGPCCPVELCPGTSLGWDWLGMGSRLGVGMLGMGPAQGAPTKCPTAGAGWVQHRLGVGHQRGCPVWGHGCQW